MCIGDARKCVKHTTARCTVDDTIHACKMDGFSPHSHPSSSFPPHMRIEPARASCIKKKELAVLAITCNYESRAISVHVVPKRKGLRRVRRRASKPCAARRMLRSRSRATRNYLHGTSSYIDMLMLNRRPMKCDFPFRKGEQMCALLQFYDTRNGYASLYSLYSPIL